MGQTNITSCRLCKSRRLKTALKINDKQFLICQVCTLLQRAENISYDITIDLTSGDLSFDYFPYFLIKNLPFPVSESTCFLFSLKAIESLLELQGFKITSAETTDEGKIEVKFEKLDSLDKIRLLEMSKKLGSQFTYFLYSVKKK